MNFIFISPNFPSMYHRFGAALKMLGANVLGIGDDFYQNLSESQKTSLTEYYRVENLHNYDQVLRGVGYFTHRYGKIDQIDSFNEYWLELESQLRTDFNIPGINISEIKQMQRKSHMNNIFQKANVKKAEGVLYESPEQVRKFIEDVGYPIIAKPDKGVGAQHTYKINNKDDLEAFIQTPEKKGYFLQVFIQGQLESFDGLTDQAGHAVFYTSHIFCQGIMEIVLKDLDLMYYSRREIPEDLIEAGLSLLKVLNIKKRFFHIEFFRTPENQLYALEINLRPPGGLTVDMFNFANDFDIYHHWANVVLFNQFDAAVNRPYHVCYVGRKNKNQYSLSHQEVIDLAGTWLVHHEPISPVFRDAIGDYGYILRDQELNKVTRLANLILQKV
jgi:biotin carboxylase